jgi:hypothetical protein
MGIIPYTKKMFLQRVRKHVSDTRLISDSFSASDKEIILYIDSALAVTMVGQVYNNAKIEGNIAVPEAYLTTYSLPRPVSDSDTGYWFSSLPQPPVSLPLGYSINRVYFADPQFGVSQDAIPIKAKRLGYRMNLPMPTGVRYWVENKLLWLAASNNQSLANMNLKVQMVKTRTDDISEDMALPDDAIEGIFSKVVQTLVQRYGFPQDVIQDNLPAGNKSS